MAANTQPIFTVTPALTTAGNAVVLTTAAADYTGVSPYNQVVYKAGANGSYINKLRFKALGSCAASVARVYIVPAAVGHLASLLGTPATPTGTPSSSGGVMLTGTYFYKIVAVDSTGALSAVSTESSGQSVTGPTGSCAVSWTATSGASSYRIYVGTATGTQTGYFTSNTNSYTQITMLEANGNYGFPISSNSMFWDEVALPLTTAIATTSTVTIDLPINIAIPANYYMTVGLGTTVSAGWSVVAVAGAY